jgi:hypothetical protein
LSLIVTLLAPIAATAQDASTPVAESTEAPPEPTPNAAPETPTEAPTPAPTSEPTAEPTPPPVPNSDTIAPLTAPVIIAPGQRLELIVSYQITTERLETGIEFSLRTPDGLPADRWVIEAGEQGGFSSVRIVSDLATPQEWRVTLHITAPDDLKTGDWVELLATSIMRTPQEIYETGVDVDFPLGTLQIVAPEPTPTEPTPTEPPAEPTAEPTDSGATPAVETPAPEETPSPEPTVDGGDATPIPETPIPASPVPASPIPASPVAETPTPEVTPSPTPELASELTLLGRKATQTVAIGTTRTVTLDYRYTAGFARAGTTISARLENWNGEAMPGWSVQLNGATGELVDLLHLEAGSSFDLDVTITVDETVQPNTKARLMFTVTVNPALTAGPNALMLVDDPQLSETFDGPMLRLDGEFSPSVVSPTNNGLTCHDPNASYPSGAADSMIPGQVAQFRCDMSVKALAIALNFSGTATIQGANTAGWQVAVSSQIALLGLPLAAPAGTFSTTSASFSSLGVLSLSAILGAEGMSFSVFVRAPSLPISLAPVSSISIVVNTTCVATLLVLSSACPGSGPTTATSTLTATVRDVKTTTYGGGGLTDLGLLGSLGSQVADGLVFRLSCNTPTTGTQVEPLEIVSFTCNIVSLINLNLLGSVSTITADVSIGFTDPSSNWKLYYNGAPVTGVINVPLGTVLNAGVLSASASFIITLQYNGGACVTTPFSGQPLNAVTVTAKYHLKLVSLAEVGLSDGWASVPIQLEGASTSPVGYTPLLSGSGVSFGTFRYSGGSSSYTQISGGTSLTLTINANGTANCSARPWYVTAQFSALTGYSNPGYTNPLGTSIPVNRISITGASGSYANTTLSTPAVTGAASTVVQSTNLLESSMNISFAMALNPAPSQAVGYYLGTVTVTMVSGTPP